MYHASDSLIETLVSTVLGLLALSKPTQTHEGEFNVMQFPPGNTLVGKIMLVVWSLVYIIFLLDTIFDFSWTGNPTTLGDYLGLNIFFLVAISFSVILIAYGKYVVMFNEKKIIFHGLFGKVKEIYWKDIVHVSFSKVALQFYLSDKSNKIYVHKHLSGFNLFTEQLKSSVDTTVIQKALIDLKESGNR